MKEKLLQTALENVLKNKKVFGTSFCIHSDTLNWCGASGNLQTEDPFFIASTTKLYTAALIMHARFKGLLQLNDPISTYLSHDVIENLHTFKGKEYSKNITLEHLLAHTSGIPDYFQGKNAAESSLQSSLMKGLDTRWDFETAIRLSKEIRPAFAPGTPKKAHYSDTNYQLLGKIIENISGKNLSSLLKEVIFEPLNLKKTYLYTDESDTTPKGLYYKSQVLHIPKAMTSFGADGGIVSTSQEMMIFLKSFFGGAFFPKTYIEEMCVWNKIFFPLQSGIGIHRFKLPFFFNLNGKFPDFIGHSGLSGALAFYSPKENLYLTGTVNQIAYPDLSYRLLIKLAQILFKTD